MRVAFAEAKMTPFVADVVHVQGPELLRLGASLARRWGSRLVYEPLAPGGREPSPDAVGRADLRLEGGAPPGTMLKAYARLGGSAGPPDNGSATGEQGDPTCTS
jgi:hypothetical protein